MTTTHNSPKRRRKSTGQPGIFVSGARAHQLCLFDRKNETSPRTLITRLARSYFSAKSNTGVQFVLGFRPELWRQVLPRDAPADIHGYDEDIRGRRGLNFPGTQHDAVLWVLGERPDLVFDFAMTTVRASRDAARLVEATQGWSYHQNRDLIDFVDGTENPSSREIPDVTLIPPHRRGTGGTVLLVQKWRHKSDMWRDLPTGDQEKVIGRTKSDDRELTPLPVSAHVSRTNQETFGKILRRNFPYGTVLDHGTMFVGFCAEQAVLERMLRNMLGESDGIPDALTHYSRPKTGGYYFVPPPGALAKILRR